MGDNSINQLWEIIIQLFMHEYIKNLGIYNLSYPGNIFGSFLPPIVVEFYQYFPHRSINIHKSFTFLLMLIL